MRIDVDPDLANKNYELRIKKRTSDGWRTVVRTRTRGPPRPPDCRPVPRQVQGYRLLDIWASGRQRPRPYQGMTSALFGLLGVLLGAALSWAGTAWSERMRRQHEHVLVARTEKVDAYGTFSMASKEYVAVLYRLAGGMGIDSQTEHIELAAAQPLLDAAFHSRDTAFERMRLVGSTACIARAREWVQVIYEMREYLSTSPTDRASWAALVARANEARDSFHAQARDELALT